MKIPPPLQSFLSKGRIFQPFCNPKPLLLNKFASCNNDLGCFSSSFTNPARECHMENVSFGGKVPLHIKLPATCNNNQARVYTGDYPSVTTILDATRPKSDLFALLNWRRKLITDLGEEGYKEKLANIKSRGTSFHVAIRQFLSTGLRPELHESNQGHWESVQHVLSSIDEVLALESVVVHPDLQYAGTLDGLVLYQGKPCVIDWKTSEKKRTLLKDCFSYPHQIVAYAGAVNHDENYASLQVCNGLLVLAYSDGSAADTIWMSPETCQLYWKEWLLRVELYNQLSKTSSTCPSSLQVKQGKNMKDFAQFVDGVPVKQKHIAASMKVVKPRLCKEQLEYTSTYDMDPTDWTEAVVDVTELDPSMAEFENSSESQTEVLDCEGEWT